LLSLLPKEKLNHYEVSLEVKSIEIGDYVKADEAIASIETGKAAVDIKSPINGRIVKFFAEVGATVLVGNDFAVIDEKASPAEAKEEKKSEPAAKPPKTEKKEPKVEAKPTTEPAKPKPKAAESPKIEIPPMKGSREVRRVPMSRLRDTAAKRLKEAQNTYAMLTTFNECDMSALTKLRKTMGPEFLDIHGVKLGFMSAFIKASVMSLQKFPAINAVIEGKDIVYHDYVDMSVAVSAPKGLVVPVLRNCESMSFAQIEKVIKELIVDNN